MYREKISKVEQSKREILKFNLADHYTEAVNGRYDNDNENLSDLINTEEYGSKPNIFTDIIDNSREQNTDTIVSIMSNEGLNRINKVDRQEKGLDDSKQMNNIYIDFKESFSMKRVLNSKSSDGRLKENAREEREKYYFENEKNPCETSNILLNISNMDQPKETKEKKNERNESKENKYSSKLLLEIKKKNKKVNNNLNVFLKAPENLESLAKLTNFNEEENGSKNEKLKIITPENGRAKKLSDVSLLDDKTFPNSHRKSALDNSKLNTSNNTKYEGKSNASNVRNITDDHTHKNTKAKDSIRETYLDRYKNKKNISTLSDNENRDVNLKNNNKLKKIMKTNENSDRLYSENNQSTLGENDTKHKKHSSVVNVDKKLFKIKETTRRQTQVDPVSSNTETDRTFNSVINLLKTSYDESKSNGSTFVLRFNTPKTGKKSSSIIKNQKEKIVDVNWDFSVFIEEIINYNNSLTNSCKRIKDLEERIQKYKLKELDYIEDIDDLKYKSNLLLTELKKTGNFDKTQINIDTIDINNNKLIFETISNVVVNETQNKPDFLPLTKSYLCILKEIGIDSAVFFSRTKQQTETENDFCEKCEEKNENHKCGEGKWNYRRLFLDYPKLKLLLIALANKYNSEVNSRLKSEEKSLKVMMNGLKNLENLDNKVKILERKNNSMIKNEHNKSSISSIHSGMYGNDHKDEFILKEIY